MEMHVARYIYNDSHCEYMDFEDYLNRLQNGIELLKKNTLNKVCSYVEMKAMKLALEYNLELMLKKVV